MARALKVFWTSAGFYEAVVAVPSRKAALAAWGVHDDLFASGAAQEVNDPELREAALARPGEIVRVPIAVDAVLAEAATRPSPTPKPGPKPPPVQKPVKSPPDRTALTAAEAALREAQKDRDRRVAELAQARRSLEDREAQVRRAADEAVRAALTQVDQARRAYQQAGGGES